MDIQSVAAGEYHSLALCFDGTVVCWGNDSSGQCTVPDHLTGVHFISAGGYHNIAMKGTSVRLPEGLTLLDDGFLTGLPTPILVLKC